MAKQHKIMNKLLEIPLCMLLISLASCGADNREQRNLIAVSIEPQRHIVESLAGDEYEVMTVLDRGANPENFEMSMSQRLDLERSRAYIKTGTLSFEDRFAPASGSGVVVETCDSGIEPVYGTHHHHHDDDVHCDGHDGDPHIWSSTRNQKIIARNICEILTRLNPDRKLVYVQRLDSLCASIDSLESYIVSRLSSADVRSFAVWHPSLSYFARDFGLRQIAVGQESKEISPMRLRQIVDSASERQVGVFFYQKEMDSRQAQTISERIGAKLVEIDPLAYDWMQQFKIIADELAK